MGKTRKDLVEKLSESKRVFNLLYNFMDDKLRQLDKYDFLSMLRDNDLELAAEQFVKIVSSNLSLIQRFKTCIKHYSSEFGTFTDCEIIQILRNPDEGCYSPYSTKASEGTTFYLEREQKTLDEWTEGLLSDFLSNFWGDDEMTVKYQLLSIDLHKAFDNANDLRKEFMQECARNKIPIPPVNEVLGKNGRGFLMTFNELKVKDFMAIIKKIAKLSLRIEVEQFFSVNSIEQEFNSDWNFCQKLIALGVTEEHLQPIVAALKNVECSKEEDLEYIDKNDKDFMNSLGLTIKQKRALERALSKLNPTSVPQYPTGFVQVPPMFHQSYFVPTTNAYQGNPVPTNPPQNENCQPNTTIDDDVNTQNYF